jgi:septum formation topological specificity factor MinE
MMNIFGQRKKEVVRERYEIMVTKPNFLKKNHYTLPTMPKERKAIKKVICNHLPRPHKEKRRGYHHDINGSIK